MKVVFVTHNKLGLTCLEELVNLDADIQAVYTRPLQNDISDQAQFESFTDQHGIPLHRVESVNTDAVRSQIEGYNPDLLFVIGWSRIVNSEILNIPSVAALGMHPAPLPRGRGRAPLAWAIIRGLDKTALSLFHLVERPDAGDLVGQQSIPIELEDDASSLYGKVVDAGRILIQDCYPIFTSGTVPRTPQDDSKATWWPKREPHHGLIDWNRPPEELYDWIRGQTRPYPGAFTYLGEEKITIWEANPPIGEVKLAKPGQILYAEDGYLGVSAWEGVIEITELQVGEDNPVAGSLLITEYDYQIGDVFENVRDLVETNE